MYTHSFKSDLSMIALHRIVGISPKEVFLRSRRYVEIMCGAITGLGDNPRYFSLATRIWTKIERKLLLRISFLWIIRWLIALADRCVTDYSGNDIRNIHEKLITKTEPLEQDWTTLHEAFEWANWYLWWDGRSPIWWLSYPVYDLEQDGEFDKAGELLWRKSKLKDAYDGTLQHAVSCFVKAGEPEKVRRCCEELYERFGIGYEGLNGECVKALDSVGELETLCNSVKALSGRTPDCLWMLGKETAALKRYDLAAELCIANWIQGRDPSCLYDAIEWSKKAGRSADKIRQLYEAVYLASKSTDPFLTERPLTNSLRWLWKNGQLETFVANVAAHNAGPVWNELDDLIEFNVKKADNPEDYELISRLMLKCYKAAESCDKPFSWLGGKISKSHVMHRSAECYETIGHLKDAANLYTQLGDRDSAAKCFAKAGQYNQAAALWEKSKAYEQAGYAYEKGGLIDKAIDCYKKAAGEKEYGRHRLFRELAEMLRMSLDSKVGQQASSEIKRVVPKIGNEWQIASQILRVQNMFWSVELVLEREKEAEWHFGFDVVGKLYESIGSLDRAAACYRAAGRKAKAERLFGGDTYQIKETLECLSNLKERHLLSSPLAQAYLGLGDRCAAVRACLDSGARDEAQKLACRWGWMKHLPSDFYPLQPELDIQKQLGDEKRVRELRKELSEAKKWARQHIRQFLDEGEQSITDPGATRHFDSYRLDQATTNHVKIGDYGTAKVCVEEILKRSNMPYNDFPEDYCLFRLSALAYLEGNFADALSLLQEQKLFSEKLLKFKALLYLRLGDFSSAVSCLVQEIMREYSTSGQKAFKSIPGLLRTVADIYRLDGNREEELNALRLAETVDRQMGIWAPVVRDYLDRQLFAEMERVCREEGELDVVAYMYDRQGMSRDAARILSELSGQT